MRRGKGVKIKPLQHLSLYNSFSDHCDDDGGIDDAYVGNDDGHNETCL